MGEGAQIKGHTVSSCGASRRQSKWETACTKLVMRELGRGAIVTRPTTLSMPSTEFSQHPRWYLAPKVLQMCSHLVESAPARDLLEMQVLGPHLLNPKLEDRPRVSSTVGPGCELAQNRPPTPLCRWALRLCRLRWAIVGE